ncbi:LOW QUALITY PROTEIN: hypothetical protein V2J09_016525 [Rumex salicifolius]
MKDCPRCGKLLAFQEGLEESQSTDDEQGRMGCLQLLGAVQKEAGQTQRGLMFMEIRIVGRSVDALIDTGATHNFMRPDLAKNLGLKLAKGTESIKMVNSEAQPIPQVVPVEIGTWTGKLDFSVAPMDDFALVLNMDRMWHNNFVPLPYQSSLVVMEKATPRAWCQRRWQDFLAVFGFELVYKTGRSNVVAYAISRKEKQAAITTTNTDLVEAIKEGLEADPVARSLMKLAKEEKSPFEIATDRQPLTPHTLPFEEESPSPAAGALVDSWRQQVELARSHLTKAQKRMKKWADTRRHPLEFRVGDLSMMKLLPQQLNKGLLRRYEGPFEILAKVGKVAYKLALPDSLKVHPVVHMSMLKPYHPDPDEPSRGESLRAPTLMFQSYERAIKEILANREEVRATHNQKLGPLGGTTKRRIFLGEGEGRVAVQGGESQVLAKKGDRSIDGDEGVARFGGGVCNNPSTQAQFLKPK